MNRPLPSLQSAEAQLIASTRPPDLDPQHQAFIFREMPNFQPYVPGSILVLALQETICKHEAQSIE